METSDRYNVDSVPLSAPRWEHLALSIVQQSLRDAADGDYTALEWLTTEGRDWLTYLGIPIGIVDDWAIDL
jgi:hypothetical protein